MSEHSSYAEGKPAPERTAPALTIGPRLRLASEFGLCLFWAAAFLLLMQLMASVAFFLVTGLFSAEFASAQGFAAGGFSAAEIQSAMNTASSGPQGEEGFYIRMSTAMLVCVGPVLLKAIRLGSHYLLDGSLFSRAGLVSLVARWAGVLAAAVLAGIIGSF